MISTFENILDSTPFKIFFAVWTGVYLVQVLRRTSAISVSSEILWIGIAFVVALFVIPASTTSSSS
jgi:hypothetical protein